MSVIDKLIQDADQPQEPQPNSFFSRFLRKPANQHSIVCLMNKNIVMSRELLKRLVIVDDSDLTYRAYMSKSDLHF